MIHIFIQSFKINFIKSREMNQKIQSPTNLTTILLISVISSLFFFYFPFKNFSQKGLNFEEVLNYSYGMLTMFILTHLVGNLIMNLIFSRYFSETQMNQYSSLLFSLIFAGMIIPFINNNITKTRDSLNIGLYWGISFLLYTMVYGLIVKGQSFGKWIDEYNIFNGKFGSLVFLSQMASPIASVLFLQ